MAARAYGAPMTMSPEGVYGAGIVAGSCGTGIRRECRVAKKPSMQGTGPESHESVMGDAIPRNGVEGQATRRTHMREQTMARQAAERKALRPSTEAHLTRSLSG